jgi:disaggregatase-related protein/TGF-beta propeptide/pectate lyase-like protein
MPTSRPEKETTRRKAPVRFLLLIALLAAASPVFAGSTYYLATNGSDSNPGTSAAPWQTFSKAWSVMAPGDTLLVKSGRYFQAIRPTISGTSGNPITVRSEVDGGAILDGQGARSGIEIFSNPPTQPTLQYITIEGFRVESCGERAAVRVSSQDGTPLSGETNNVVIRRTGARGDAMSSNNTVWEVSRSRDSLLEDVWGWGLGRYVIQVYGDTRVTVRRGVFRWDGWGQGASKPQDPKFNLGVYNTHDSLIENVLLLDAADDPLGGDKGGLYVPGNSNGNTAPYTDSDDNVFKGVISLNNVGVGVSVEGGSGGTNDNNRFVDLVSWGNSYVGVTVHKNAAGTTFDHVTVGHNSDGFYLDAYNNVSGTAVTNSLVYANPGNGIGGPATTSYNNVFGNGTNSAGTNGISQDPRLDYIVRIESDSPDKGTAGDGGDRGANVLKQSVNGALTATDLWPWPYEDRIRADLCESETRGFCAPSWASLTDYVWGQLGNPWPPPDTTPTCPTASYPDARWQNQGFTAQSGSFTAEADVTPSSAAVDAALSVSSGPQTNWDNLAATVLFYSDGTVQARNGGAYTVGTVHYTGGTAYHVRMVVDIASHTYSAYVTPAGGSEQTLGTSLAFRTGQGAVTSLDDWTLSADAGSLTACGFKISPATTPPLPQTQVFQQGLSGYTGVTDTWINVYDPNLNFNSETKLNVQGTEDIKALVRFDLSSIPPGTPISSATLSLYNYAHAASAEGGTLSVYPVSKVWVESQATWNRSTTANAWAAPGMLAGTDYATSPVTSITIDTAAGVWRTFDVTALVQSWVNGTLPNDGFVVRSPTRGVKPLFYSSGYASDPALRPKLTIQY